MGKIQTAFEPAFEPNERAIDAFVAGELRHDAHERSRPTRTRAQRLTNARAEFDAGAWSGGDSVLLTFIRSGRFDAPMFGVRFRVDEHDSFLVDVRSALRMLLWNPAAFDARDALLRNPSGEHPRVMAARIVSYGIMTDMARTELWRALRECRHCRLPFSASDASGKHRYCSDTCRDGARAKIAGMRHGS